MTFKVTVQEVEIAMKNAIIEEAVNRILAKVLDSKEGKELLDSLVNIEVESVIESMKVKIVSPTAEKAST